MITTLLISVSTFKTYTHSSELDSYLGRIAEGDQNALSSLYCAASASVYGYALSVLKNTHDAEDVLQDAFIHIYNAASGYSSEGKPMAWIISITRNLCLQRLREHKRTADLPQEDWEPYLRSKEGLSGEDRLVLEQCMLALTDEERQIVVLHAVAGFKHRELAALLELPLSTVLSKYNRALKKLQTSLRKGEIAP